MEVDRERNAGTGEGVGRLPRASPEPGPDALTTALARVMDAVTAELVLCTPAGSVLHANHPARKRLDVDGGRKSLGEEIRFLCVALHLQIAENAGGEGTEPDAQAERRVTLDGSEMHLRAVDLGLPRHGRSPAVLVLLDARDSLSEGELKQLGLTRAEIQIVRLVVQGRTNREIAHALSISVHTVRHHVQHIHDKMGVRSRAQLVETFRR